jgi:hypothetical protein
MEQPSQINPSASLASNDFKPRSAESSPKEDLQKIGELFSQMAGIRNRVPAANTRQHLPQRIQNRRYRLVDGCEVRLVNTAREQLALYRGMFPVSFNVDSEVRQSPRIIDSVEFDKTINLGFRHGRNLALISVQCGKTLGGAAIAANSPKGFHQLYGFFPWLGLLDFCPHRTYPFGEVKPKIGVIGMPAFLIHQIRKNVTARDRILRM